jgi:hypothetical protein
MRSDVLAVAAGLVLASCASAPTGPTVMVLPGTGKNFEEFQTDDGVCRQWAAQQIGTKSKKASTMSTTGTNVEAGYGQSSGSSAQRRYDMTYMQCMYAKGNQIPVGRGPTPYSSQQGPPPPPPANMPPPPAGTFPPPPEPAK